MAGFSNPIKESGKELDYDVSLISFHKPPNLPPISLYKVIETITRTSFNSLRLKLVEGFGEQDLYVDLPPHPLEDIVLGNILLRAISRPNQETKTMFFWKPTPQEVLAFRKWVARTNAKLKQAGF